MVAHKQVKKSQRASVRHTDVRWAEECRRPGSARSRRLTGEEVLFIRTRVSPSGCSKRCQEGNELELPFRGRLVQAQGCQFPAEACDVPDPEGAVGTAGDEGVAFGAERQ